MDRARIAKNEDSPTGSNQLLEELLKDFGQQLRDYRERERPYLSRRRLELRSRISASYVTKVEQGKLQPSPEFLDRWLGEHGLNLSADARERLRKDYEALRRFRLSGHPPPYPWDSDFHDGYGSLVKLTKLLEHRRMRLVTIVGVTGKTRVATEAIRITLRDGLIPACFVDLTLRERPGQLPRLLAQALGLAVPKRLKLANVLAMIDTQKVIILLDGQNREQLGPGTDELFDETRQVVRKMLENCPGIRVVVTGTQALGLRQELVFWMPDGFVFRHVPKGSGLPPLELPPGYERQSIASTTIYAYPPKSFEKLHQVVSSPRKGRRLITIFGYTRKTRPEIEARLIREKRKLWCQSGGASVQKASTYVVDLMSRERPGELPRLLAEAARIVHPERVTLENVLESVGDQRTVILFMDEKGRDVELFEETIQVVSSFLKHCPLTRIIVSSERALGLPGEELLWMPYGHFIEGAPKGLRPASAHPLLDPLSGRPAEASRSHS
jgi:transcriptional regulator with XRE-family HTH domain